MSDALAPRTFAVWVLIVLLIVQAVGAIGGGAVLVISPDGSLMRMPLSQLEGSPFDSFLVPGLILLVVLGIAPLVAAIGLVLRRTWAWWLAGVVGCGLLIWIGVEMTIVQFDWLQPTYFGMGLAIVLACLPRSVRRYAGVARAAAGGT
jgi:hypothetical protein